MGRAIREESPPEGTGARPSRGDEAGLREEVRLWRPSDLPGVEVLRANYITQSFAWHAHETFAFGVIERGGLAFRFRGIQEVAPMGHVTLAFPGEPHTGHGMDRRGWSYRMFYADPSRLEAVAREVAPDRRGLPPLLQGVLSDPALATALRGLHLLLERGPETPLEIQERLQALLARLVRRHARWDADPPQVRPDGLVLRARRLLEERYAEGVSLAELASAAGCGPFRLVRAFREALGMPPHAWQLQLRVRRGQELLRRGREIADVAAELGFVDQSHFHRTFRRLVGMTPGAYAAQARPLPPSPTGAA